MKRLTQWLAIGFAALILAAVFFYIQQKIAAQGDRPMPPRAEQKQRSEVRVVTQTASRYNAIVTAYGEAQAHYSLTLQAQTEGEVIELADNFEAGQQVKKDTTLISLDDSRYRASLNSAQYDLANAQLNLLEIQREASQARAEWEAAGLEGEPDSELTLYQPQVDTAEVAVRNYRAAVVSAQQTLSNTRIRIPFDALITERHVAPGSYVQSGSDIATLLSTDRVEIPVALASRDWARLPPLSSLSKNKWPVTLSSVEGQQQWHGYVLRATQHLDESTRQRQLIVAVDQPFEQSPALYPGTFVKLQITGLSMDALWKLPSSALSQRNEIWYVQADETLNKFETSTVFADANSIYIAPPSALSNGPQRILTHPLSSYLQGMTVDAVESSDNE